MHAPHGEDAEAVSTRYDSIANDAVKVAFDKTEQPLFKGPHARIKTAQLLVTIARYESNFVKRIDDGECRKGECDNGAAHCIMQVHTDGGGLVLDSETYSHASQHTKEWREEHASEILDGEALKDRRTCFRSALHKLRESLRACGNLPQEDRMGIYTGEGCKKGKENPKSRTRMLTQSTYFAQHLPPVTDEQVMDTPLLSLLP
jgi:hypothetical protein